MSSVAASRLVTAWWLLLASWLVVELWLVVEARSDWWSSVEAGLEAVPSALRHYKRSFAALKNHQSRFPKRRSGGEEMRQLMIMCHSFLIDFQTLNIKKLTINFSLPLRFQYKCKMI